MKNLPKRFNTIVFLERKLNDPDREARIKWNHYCKEYKVSNLNMPYVGSLNFFLTRKKLKELLSSRKIKLQYYG